MIETDFTVGDNGTVSAAKLLVQFGEGQDDQLEQVLSQLAEKHIPLDLSDLPAQRTMGEAAQRLKMEKKLAKDGFCPEQLEENDPLRLYLEEVAALPAYGDLSKLLEQHKTEDQTTRIVELCLSRVIEIAPEFVGYGVLLLDLIQEGTMGLMEALTGFDGDAAEFEKHRDYMIRFYMGKAVLLQAQAFGVGEKLRQATEDYRATDERLLAELGRNPTLEEIAQAMHMTPEEAENVAKTLSDIRILNRAKQPENVDLPQEEEQAVEDTAYFQMRQRIAELLSGLSQEDAKLLSLRYGLEGGVPMDAQQVGKQLGLTPEEVTQRETAALAKLRQ